MKIAVLMPIWKRPEILNVVLKNWKFPAKKMNIEFYFVLIVSKEDPHFTELVQFCKAFLKTNPVDGIVLEHENYPVATKQNVGISAILDKDWDYLMNMGSDNILAENYWNLVWPHLWERVDVILSNRVVFLDSYTQEALEMTLKLAGAGRLISRRLVEATWKKLGYFYTPHMNSGMDTCSRNNYTETVPEHSQVIVSDSFAVDIKSFTNINLFMDIKKAGNEITEIDAEGFERFANLSELCNEITDIRGLLRSGTK